MAASAAAGAAARRAGAGGCVGGGHGRGCAGCAGGCVGSCAGCADSCVGGGHGGGNLVGVGMAPEGIEQNPVVYEFAAEMAYDGVAARLAGRCGGDDDDDGDDAGGESSGGASRAPAPSGAYCGWMEAYGLRRYASAGAPPPAAAASLRRAWRALSAGAYACGDRLHSTVCDVPTSRPGLCRAEIVGWGLAPHFWYPLSELRAALAGLLEAADSHPPLRGCAAFRYDVVDAGRELLSKSSSALWAAAAAAYARRDAGALAGAGAVLCALLGDLDRLLGSHEAFMLGPTLARARAFARCCDCGGGGDDSGGGGGDDEGAGGFGAAGEERRRQLELLYEWNLRTQVRAARRETRGRPRQLGWDRRTGREGCGRAARRSGPPRPPGLPLPPPGRQSCSLAPLTQPNTAPSPSPSPRPPRSRSGAHPTRPATARSQTTPASSGPAWWAASTRPAGARGSTAWRGTCAPAARMTRRAGASSACG